MRAVLRKAGVLLAVSHAQMVEFRSEIVLWILASSFPFIMMSVWVKAGESGSYAFTATMFAQYFMAVFIVRQLTIVWVIHEFEYQVVEGKLSPLLLQPIDPVWRHVARHVMERVTRAPFLIAILVTIFLVYDQARWSPTVHSVTLGGVMVILAFALRFAMQYTFALLAFWTERATSIENLWFLVYVALSGMLGPLDLFPEWARAIAIYSPFPYLIYYPAMTLLGEPVDIGIGMALLVPTVWLIAFLILNRVVWRVALKRYSAMGA